MAKSSGRIFEGSLVGEGLKFAVVVSRFNDFITKKLLEGALDAFVRHGADPATIDVSAWRRDPGTLVVPRAGEMLYRIRK